MHFWFVCYRTPPFGDPFGDCCGRDPPVLVAASGRTKQEAGWAPQFADLDSIVGSAGRWRIAHSGGYGAGSPASGW